MYFQINAISLTRPINQTPAYVLLTVTPHDGKTPTGKIGRTVSQFYEDCKNSLVAVPSSLTSVAEVDKKLVQFLDYNKLNTNGGREFLKSFRKTELFVEDIKYQQVGDTYKLTKESTAVKIGEGAVGDTRLVERAGYRIEGFLTLDNSESSIGQKTKERNEDELMNLSPQTVAASPQDFYIPNPNEDEENAEDSELKDLVDDAGVGMKKKVTKKK